MKSNISSRQRLQGIIQPLVTPFNADETIDEAAFREQVRFHLQAGVHGFAAGGSTGEGQTFSTEELRRSVAVTVEECQGRVPVVAGLIVQSTQEALERARAVADLGVAALQITPPHYIFRPSDDELVTHFRRIADDVGIPVIIYNVIPWCYLSPALLKRIFDVAPGVTGVKQSNSDLKALADILLIAGNRAQIFTAVDALMYPSFMLGADGAIAALPTAAPGPSVALWDAAKRGDHALCLELHGKLLAVWNALTMGTHLPAAIKYALSLQGCQTGVCRAPSYQIEGRHAEAIRQAIEALPKKVNTATAA
jgi:4-hydroxy-tetrahydrodipicolinate synthase